MLVTQLCPTVCNPRDCSLPGSSVHGILQGRILEWVATPFSRGSNSGLWHLLLAGGLFTCWDTREIYTSHYLAVKSRDTVVAHVPSQRVVPLSPWLNVLESPSPTFMDKQPLPRAWLDMKLATQDSQAFEQTPMSISSLPLLRFSVLIKLSVIANTEYSPHFDAMRTIPGDPHYPLNCTNFFCWKLTHFSMKIQCSRGIMGR